MCSRVGSFRHRSRCRSPQRPRRPDGLLPTPVTVHPKALYLSYPHAIDLPCDTVFSRVFSRYGPVTRLFAHRTPRVYVIVEYEQSQDAELARTELYVNDRSGRLRAELGDSRLSISFKTERQPREESRKPFWTGQVSLTGHNPVPVTAVAVEGDCAALFATLSHVTITQRAPFTEVLMKDALAVVLFSGVGEENRSALGDVASYFYQKQRAGIVQVQKVCLYLLPPGPESVRFVPAMYADQLVGVVTSNQ